jgi:hypothetical protein
MEAQAGRFRSQKGLIMFSVGMEVICINDDDPPQSAPPFVIKGRTYTVSAVEVKPWPILQMGPIIVFQPMEFVWVAELPSKTGHFAFRFRKVEKKGKTTDIAVFRKLLDTTKIPEKVD